jgi:DNA-binding CsgD family transcriptional regulator
LLKLAKGSLRAAEQCLRGVVNDERARGDFEPDSGLPAAAGLGRLYLAEGTADAALAVTEPVIAVVTRKRVWLWVSDIASVHCDALITADRLDEADALVREFAAGIAGRDAPAAAAALVLCRGIVADAHGDSGEAAQLFAEAAHAWASMPRPYDELLSLERHGRCLLAAGEHDRALTVLADTEHRLNEMGARWDADRVAHLLRQQGVKVARTWRRGPRGYGDQLSPRELEVVELVARGMTNGQIADSLFISPKTVAKHVTVSMRKLDVSSRTSLAMAAAEAGLLSADVSQ